MQNLLLNHNGHSLEKFAADVRLINQLEAENCKLAYKVTNYETVRYDLSDIDPNTFEVKAIGPSFMGHVSNQRLSPVSCITLTISRTQRKTLITTKILEGSPSIAQK